MFSKSDMKRHRDRAFKMQIVMAIIQIFLKAISNEHVGNCFQVSVYCEWENTSIRNMQHGQIRILLTN